MQASMVEGALSLGAYVGIEAKTRGTTECPERASPAVVGRGSVDPHTLEIEPVADHARIIDGVVDEVQGDSSENFRTERTPLVVQRCDRETRVVVGAVPVTEPGVSALGVLENSAIIRESREVSKTHTLRIVDCGSCCHRPTPRFNVGTGFDTRAARSA